MKRHDTGGYLGFYGLTDWWNSEFSNSEKETILKRYIPFSLGEPNKQPLIFGNITNTSQSKVHFLYTLSSWFKSKEYIDIALKIISKAESEVDTNTEILDLHFLHSTQVEMYYKLRDFDSKYLNMAIEACIFQIELAPQAKIAFEKVYVGPLPRHKGYEQLSIIYEKNKQYKEAIMICKQAFDQKWSGDWKKRIERCKNKLDKIITNDSLIVKCSS